MDIPINNMETTTFTSTYSEDRCPMHLYLRELKDGEKMLATDLYLDWWGQLHVKGRVSFWHRKYRKGNYVRHFRVCYNEVGMFKMVKEVGK